MGPGFARVLSSSNFQLQTDLNMTILAVTFPVSLLERKHKYLRFGLFVGLISYLKFEM